MAPPSGWLSMPPLRFRRAWLLSAALLVAIVLLFGVTRVPPSLKWLMVDDKLMHAAAYAAMSAAFAQLLLDRRTRLLVVLALVVFGLAVECLQAQTATRQFELLDLLANTGGAFGAWLLIGRREVSLLPRLEALVSGTRQATSMPSLEPPFAPSRPRCLRCRAAQRAEPPGPGEPGRGAVR